MCNAVCHIGELLGLFHIEVVKHILFQDFAVQGRNAVDAVRADDRTRFAILT